MALLWLDSFDHYVTADIPEKYPNYSAGNSSIAVGLGRRASNGYFPGYGGITAAVVPAPFTPPALPPLLVLGLAVKFVTTPNNDIISIGLSGTNQFYLTVNNDGSVTLIRGYNAAQNIIARSAVNVFPTNVYTYIEIKALVHPTSGWIIVRLNEAVVLNVPGPINTAYSGAAGWNTVGLSGGSNNYDDDFYILDGSGPAPLNDFLGDVRVDARFPTGEGIRSEWLPSSGPDNAAMVDESAPDDDGTFNSTGTIGATDLHSVQDAPVPGAAFYGAQLLISLKKSDAGTCSVAPVVRSNNLDYQGPQVNPGTAYSYYIKQTYTNNPATGQPWTEADFNLAQFGYVRTA